MRYLKDSQYRNFRIISVTWQMLCTEYTKRASTRCEFSGALR